MVGKTKSLHPKRGDLVTISLPGDYGKPRPALVIQSDLFSKQESLTVLPITSSLVDAPFLRFSLHPSPTNHLKKESQVMIDKIMTVRMERVGSKVGKVAAESLREIERLLVLFLGIAS